MRAKDKRNEEKKNDKEKLRTTKKTHITNKKRETSSNEVQPQTKNDLASDTFAGFLWFLPCAMTGHFYSTLLP